MPWSNQNGGNGGWKKGGDGGPWGQGPAGGRGQQPDLEDIIKKSQDRIKRVMPGSGGGSSGGGSVFMFLIIAAAIAAIGFFSFTIKVNPDEVGIVTRFGKFHRQIGEGLNIRLPNPVEQVYLVKPQFANRVGIGMSADRSGQFGRRSGSEIPEESLMLTGDNNIVKVQFSVQWRIKDPKSYLFNVENPNGTVKEVAESAMREVVGQKSLDQVLIENFEENQDQVRALMQKTLDNYGAGVHISEVFVRKPDVPDEVVAAVNDVEAAKQDSSRLEQEARAYQNRVVPEARGEAAQITEAANAYKNRIVAEAKGEAERFNKIHAEYSKAPNITRERLYLETMERVFRGTDKIILDSSGSGSGVVPYLPLNELNKGASQPQGRR